MPLNDFLLPGERVWYKCPIAVRMRRRDYELYVTDQRLILFKRRGSLFKRDDFVAERISDIRSMDYREKGAFSPIATVSIQTQQKSLSIAFQGSPDRCKTAFQGLQQSLRLDRGESAPRPGPEAAAGAARELPRVEASGEYAGFWIRLVAYFIDVVLLIYISWAFVNPVYFVGLWTWRGQTLGMMAVHVKVVRTDGRPMDLGTAVLRFVGYFVCVFTLGFGFLMIAFDSQRQGLHDKIANTHVVRLR